MRWRALMLWRRACGDSRAACSYTGLNVKRGTAVEQKLRDLHPAATRRTVQRCVANLGRTVVRVVRVAVTRLLAEEARVLLLAHGVRAHGSAR